jgi:hypothetical protein
MTDCHFETWAAVQLDLDTDSTSHLKLGPVFDVFISRIEAARARGATDPLQTVTAKVAGGNSRACTKRMLEQLGFTASQRRAVHRLMAGSPSGWPGLLRLYVEGAALTDKQRLYARRQVQQVRSGGLMSRIDASPT